MLEGMVAWNARNQDFTEEQMKAIYDTLLALFKNANTKTRKLLFQIFAFEGKPENLNLILGLIDDFGIRELALPYIGELARRSGDTETIKKAREYLLSGDHAPEREKQALPRILEGIIRLDPTDIALLYKYSKKVLLRVVKDIISDARYYNQFYVKAVQLAGNLVVENPQFFEPQIFELRDIILQAKQLDRKEWKKLKDLSRKAIFDILAEAVPRMPGAWMNLASPNEIAPLLSWSCCNLTSFTARMACVRLLTFLRSVPADISPVLQSGLHDVSFVSEELINSVIQFRNIPKDLLPKIMEGLYSESTVAAYSYAKMLAAVAQDNRTETKDTLKIIGCMGKALKDKRLKREVFVVKNTDSSNDEVVYLGQLDQLVYKLVLDVVGTNSKEESPKPTFTAGCRLILEWATLRPVTVNCQFGPHVSPYSLYISDGNSDGKPVRHQQNWLRIHRQGHVDDSVINGLEKLWQLAQDSNCSFEELYMLAVRTNNDD
eukprot:CAMPEP_0168512886 /NCGR_PEP_ID=MMETSP0405-20121227/3091_1 /TAXON_ID=498012 /ORGANISM="Trichosphaerium sp, Strain Am-I-7 wt" /LENGTH=489 /DNA_ID=CAMNT_0008531527 /DNA_START=260 /DNA_END=1726 /DNA_ORIENTATION=-